MDFRTRRILFGSPFFMIYEFHAFKYLLSLFMSVNDFYLIPMVLFIEAIRIVATFTERKKSTGIGRFLSTFYGVCEWFLMMLFFYLVIVYALGSYVEIPKIAYLLMLFIPLIIGVYAYMHAHKIIIKKRVLEFDNLKRKYNIIHLSDVHFGSIRHEDIIEDITSKIKSVEDECDLAIISGDLADGSCIVEENDFLPLKKVEIPIIFTSGNHDYYPGLESVHKACRKADMIVLENDSYEYEDLNVYGLSFSFGKIPMPSRDELKSAIKEDKINIVNYHVPRGWDYLSDMGFDVQLSGHTHGGQFYPATFIGEIIYKGHNMGLFKKVVNDENHYLHVTTGVGCMDVPMRWGTDSEMVILKFVEKK
ncbi:MAG: metallophosphatase [Methanosphaera sp. rholeuAM130]|nr:MAG: metallophosphatase [Methanosphaera sp. rholeuAM130]